MTDEVILGAIVAIAVAVINAVLAYFQRVDKKEAEAEGDTIMAGLKTSVDMLKAFVPFVPAAKDAVDAYEKVVYDIEEGWNDKAVTNAQLMDVLTQGRILVAQIKGMVGK